MHRLRAGIITASDTRSAGTAADETTAALQAQLEHSNITVVECVLIPDQADLITAAIVRLADKCGADLVLTTGGTGLSPRDVTPEATRLAIDREVPGIAELLRAASAPIARHAWLSRGIAGTRGTTLVVNLPGSLKGAVECASLVLPLVPHAAAVMRGAGHDTTTPTDVKL